MALILHLRIELNGMMTQQKRPLHYNRSALMKKIMIASILMLSFFGCSNDSVFEGLSDDSSMEATLEQAAIDLDDGNYEEVINSLAGIYTTTALDPEVARLLASGYMGKAGIDLTNFIFYSADDEADNFDSIEATLSLYLAPEDEDEDDDEPACNVSNGSVLIVDGDGVFIDGHCIEEMIYSLDRAKEIISDLQAAELDTPGDHIQLGLTAAVHYVFIVGNTTADALNTTLRYPEGDNRYKPGSVPVPINKEAYRLYKYSDDYDYTWYDVDAEDFYEQDNDGDGLTRYQEDLINVYDAIHAIDQAISQPNEIRDELEEFLREVLSMPTGEITDDTIIETVTSTGIFEYIDNI